MESASARFGTIEGFLWTLSIVLTIAVSVFAEGEPPAEMHTLGLDDASAVESTSDGVHIVSDKSHANARLLGMFGPKPKDWAKPSQAKELVYLSRIDLDLEAMDSSHSGAFGTARATLSEIATMYAMGRNSIRSDSSVNTFKRLSAELGPALSPSFHYAKIYWNSPTYGDDLISQALSGDGAFAGKSDVMRSEAALKGAAYVVAGMHAIQKMDQAVAMCTAGIPLQNYTAGRHAWSEAIAVYTGSMWHGAGEHSGRMSFSLAEKTCATFGTCLDDRLATTASQSSINRRIIVHLSAAVIMAGATRPIRPLNPDNEVWLQWLRGGNHCKNAAIIAAQAKRMMLVPLVQGMVLSAFKSDPIMLDQSTPEGYTETPDRSKDIARGWAFAVALLPEIHVCNATAAQTIRKYMDPKASTDRKTWTTPAGWHYSTDTETGIATPENCVDLPHPQGSDTCGVCMMQVLNGNTRNFEQACTDCVEEHGFDCSCHCERDVASIGVQGVFPEVLTTIQVFVDMICVQTLSTYMY
jgi:hypothetical protein